MFDVVDVLRKVASERSVPVSAIALAWLLQRPVVTSVILGAKRVDRLEENLLASDIVLEPGEVQELNEVSGLSAEYPGWVLDFELWRRTGG